MASYKVLQDIEAEDKLLGPLTLRQFIYGGICAATLYLSFLLLTKGAAFALVIFLPIAGVAGFFAFPWKGEQPTEIWALAKIRFMLKPRRRIWNQSGVKELVTVTAPKRVENDYTNGLSQTEVKSRLRALADTIDSRGWAVKNINVNLYAQPALVMSEPTSDRLVQPETMPREVPNNDIQPSDDMLDPQNNPVAHQFDTMIAASSKAHRQKIMEQLQQATATSDTKTAGKRKAEQPAQPANNYWFMNQAAPNTPVTGSPPQDAVTFNAQLVTPAVPAQATTTFAPANQPSSLPAPDPTLDEAALVQQLHEQEKAQAVAYNHLHTIQPLSAQKRTPKPVQNTPQPKVTQQPDAAILNLARNDDLNVATIAREAQKQRPEPPQDEVVISLR